jgi:Protein of unknown function (DUF2917)
MDRSKEQFVLQTASGTLMGEDALPPQVVILLNVLPKQFITWRVRTDSELRAGTKDVRVSRIFIPYDHLLQPGDVLRLTRGERIWLSTDAEMSALISLTSACAGPRKPMYKWFERLCGCLVDISLLRPR